MSRHGLEGHLVKLGVTERALGVAKRVFVGAYTYGFTHAGNLAYLSLVTLFPFFIVAAAAAQLFGRTEAGLAAVAGFLNTLPPDVAALLRPAIIEVLEGRTGSLLWLGALVGLWTTSGLVETIRAILLQAYRTKTQKSFLHLRLAGIGMVIGSVVLAMLAFSLQFLMVGAEEFILRVIPMASEVANSLAIIRIVPAITLFGALFLLFYMLTPQPYRRAKSPKWPGPLLVTVWWITLTMALPRVLASFGGYGMTYGSLAGVMVALIFFFLIGFGVVIGAELNAALAESPENGLEGPRDNKEATQP